MLRRTAYYSWGDVDTDLTDGEFDVLSQNSAYCPWIYNYFINGSTYASATSKYIKAWYRCDTNGQGSGCSVFLGTTHYHRCNPTGTCDNLLAVKYDPSLGFPVFALLNVAYLVDPINNLADCVAGKPQARADMCISPDPTP
jgi:hypothetical protein